MKKLQMIILTAGLVLATTSIPSPIKAKNPAAAFGACYTLSNCQGGSIGSFSDTQCRQLGGRSMNSGGICINL